MLKHGVNLILFCPKSKIHGNNLDLFLQYQDLVGGRQNFSKLRPSVWISGKKKHRVTKQPDAKSK